MALWLLLERPVYNHRQIGFRGFSTVWLAEDIEIAFMIFIGLDICGLKAIATASDQTMLAEATIWWFAKLCKECLSFILSSRFLDRLVQLGPNRTHRFLSFALRRSTIQQSISRIQWIRNPWRSPGPRGCPQYVQAAVTCWRVHVWRYGELRTTCIFYDEKLRYHLLQLTSGRGQQRQGKKSTCTSVACDASDKP